PPAPTATLSGLACGTTLTRAVDAADAAGNRSAAAAVSGSTQACPAPAPTASFFVATSGSDTNACTQSAPCKTFERAYTVAQPGQAVEVAAGTYGDQNLLFDSSKTSSSDVVFRPAPGASVTIGDLDFGAGRSHAAAR